MAVSDKDRPSTNIASRDYWGRYQKEAIALIIAMQFVVMTIVAIALLVVGSSTQDLMFWIILVSIFATSSFLNIVLTNQLLLPLKDVTTALSSAQGQSPKYALANPNTVRYQRDGFRDILQFVYELSSSNHHKKELSDKISPELKKVVSAIHNTKAGIIILDTDGQIIFSNPSAPVSIDSDNKLQLELLFEQNNNLTDWIKQAQEKSVRANKTWSRIPNKILGEEKRRIFNISANYDKGSDSEIVLVTFDATDEYQVEDDELDFIAFAAHELRGPITVIRGYLDVLDIELKGKIELEQKELIDRLVVSASRLSSYISNILNTSKYDRRHLQLNLIEESIVDVYEAVEDDLGLRASSQQKKLVVDIPADLPTVAIDHSSIGEVIINLVDNALKYSNDRGVVEVSASATAEFVKVSIKDDGIGIPSNIIGNLFKKFYRSHRSRETVAGTGIGLYLCKAIIESHGGKIEVSSKVDEGSTFSFTLPTYDSVADKLRESGNTNKGLITSNEGWIKNHSMYKG